MGGRGREKGGRGEGEAREGPGFGRGGGGHGTGEFFKLKNRKNRVFLSGLASLITWVGRF